MSFYLVTGRVERDVHGERKFVVSPSLDDVDLDGATVHLSYAYETDDQPFACAAAVEATEVWSLRGAVDVRAFPCRLPTPWPPGSAALAPEVRADAREEIDRE